jgi:ABC-2 type transport system ATP-binding protein
MAAIKIENLSKVFETKQVVDNLNLSINEGELFSLLGMNGAGKTTTIRMLSCLIPPTGGDAILLGDSIVSDSQKVKEKINLSPQETAVAMNLSVQENLEFIAQIYGDDKKRAQQKAIEIMDRFGLTKVAKSKTKILSGGMQRRLSIAMALITDPKILFLDEPTLGLDVLARRELWAAINDLKGKITIILTTHYMEEAAALSDRIGIISNGILRAVGTVPELMAATSTTNLEEAFISYATTMEGSV